MIKLKSIINSLDKYNRYGSEYYKIIDLWQHVNDVEILNLTEDMILTPFYLTSSSTYEIYDYELNIRKAKQNNKKSFFLTKTGKSSIKEIDQEIFYKLELCYIETTKERCLEATEQFKMYLDYLLNNSKVKERVPTKLGPFDNNNLYFEAYF